MLALFQEFQEYALKCQFHDNGNNFKNNRQKNVGITICLKMPIGIILSIIQNFNEPRSILVISFLIRWFLVNITKYQAINQAFPDKSNHLLHINNIILHFKRFVKALSN